MNKYIYKVTLVFQEKIMNYIKFNYTVTSIIEKNDCKQIMK